MVKPRIYVTRKKQRVKHSVELEFTEKSYLDGGVGMSISIKRVKSSRKDLPTNNELGIDKDKR